MILLGVNIPNRRISSEFSAEVYVFLLSTILIPTPHAETLPQQ